MIRILCVVLSFILLDSCMMGPNYVRPAMPLPAHYTHHPVNKKIAQQVSSHQPLPAQWWTLFHSESLNQLVLKSIKHNPSIHAAQAALHIAFETLYAQQGSLYPTVDASFAPSKQEVAKILTSTLASNAYSFYLNTAQVSVSYLPDVFGANHRQIESLAALTELKKFELEATYLTLTSNVVLAAIQEASLRSQILGIKEIIESYTEILRILNKQLNAGDLALADIRLAEVALAQAQASLPPLEKQLALQRHILSILAGEFPGESTLPRFELDHLHLPTHLPLSLPSCLVEHRPDIRAAEALLHAASAQIGVATANRLPNIILGVNTAGSTATSLLSLFSSETNFWSLAGIVTQPIFNGGTLLHRQHAAEAAYQQTKALYREAVLNAFQNVADTLEAIQWDSIGYDTTLNAERAAKESFTIIKQQLALGDVSVLKLEFSGQSYIEAKLRRFQMQAQRLSNTVALFQALGGGWWNRQKMMTPCKTSQSSA